MPIRIREKDKISILDIDGSIDINSSDIIETVAGLVNKGKPLILINLKDVENIDYSGLSVLAIAYKNVTNHSGRLKFLHASEEMVELFKIVKLDLVFEFYDNEESALDSFRVSSVEHMHLRRRFKRLDIHIPIKYKLAESDGEYINARAVNLSAAGVYIFSHDIFTLGSTLSLEFDIAHLKKPLALQGNVVWLADKELQPHYFPGMGVIFKKIDPGKEKVLIHFIDKNISKRAETE